MQPALPSDFLESLGALAHPGYRRLPQVIGTGDSVTSIRLNPARACGKSLPFPTGEAPSWHPEGRYVDERPSFTNDPHLHQGVYYVQEASSMAVASAVRTALRLLPPSDRPVVYLDACAAPGGKTTAAIDVLGPEAFVMANEFDPRRANILIENLAKWGAEAFVTRADASEMSLPSEFFDIIAADVPCSGEGMMRKDDFAIEQWTPALPIQCSSLQRRIVDNLWEALRPGGFMIYSTCTFNLCENEEIVAHLIDEFGAEPVAIDSEFPGVVPAQGGYNFPAYRFIPGEIKGEGLFMALVQKPLAYEGSGQKKKSKPSKGSRPKATLNPSEVLIGDYQIISDEPLRAIRKGHLPIYEELSQKIKPISAGILLGQMKGRDFIPAQALALARNYRRGAFPEVAVDTPTALSYLRREAVILPSGAPKGIILLAYDGLPLGWVKNLGSRANNLYPDPWRIRLPQ